MEFFSAFCLFTAFQRFFDSLKERKGSHKKTLKRGYFPVYIKDGKMIPIPKVFTDRLNIKDNDRIRVYIAEDLLILIPENKINNINELEIQGIKFDVE